MDMPFGAFIIDGVLKLHEYLARDWSIFSCLKPLIPKLDALSGDMKGPFIQLYKNYQLACMVESRTFKNSQCLFKDTHRWLILNQLTRNLLHMKDKNHV